MVGINVIGFVSAPFGLGVAARNTVRLLMGKGVPVAVADLPLDRDPAQKDHSFDNLTIGSDRPLPYGMTVFHCNPPLIGRILAQRHAWLAAECALKIAVPFWELPVIPDVWHADLAAMDVVLCPSHFIAQTLAASLPGPRPLVRHYPQTAFIPEHRSAGRGRFGLPEGCVLFVMSFEPASDCERKNPRAAVEAFRAAFTKGEKTRLVIKLNTPHRSASVEQSIARLRDMAGSDGRIIIRDEVVAYGEVIALYEACDVYVSLHRSEGLGLGPLEAMLLGKPAIATAWSGNMDFMDELNACLVGYRLVPMASPVYGALLGRKEAVWAEPDIGEAAVWMRRLYDNAALRREIGLRAKAAMLERHRECMKAEVFDALQEICSRKKTAPRGAPMRQCREMGRTAGQADGDR